MKKRKRGKKLTWIESLKKDEEWVFEPHHFHVISFIIALSVLTVLLNGRGILLYAGVVGALLLFSHFLRYHRHKAHDSSIIIGLFLLPAAVMTLFYQDMFSWLLLVIYLFAFLSGIAVYHYHRGKHKLLHTMWHVIYSRTIAVSATLLVFYLISFVLPEGFVSLPVALIAYLLPTMFVYFTLTKFFYVYFFDSKHPVKDLNLSLRHGLSFTSVFVLILVFSYAVVGTLLFNGQADFYKNQLELSISDMDKLDELLSRAPEDVASLAVTGELQDMVLSLRDRLEDARSDADNQKLDFPKLMSDVYLLDINNNAINLAMFGDYESMLIDLKEGIFKKKLLIDNLVANDLPFEDGSKNLDERVKSLEASVNEGFELSVEDTLTKDFVEDLRNPDVPFSFYEDNGFNWVLGRGTDFDRLYSSVSLVERRFYEVLKRTVPFREFARYLVEVMHFENAEGVSPQALNALYNNRLSEESELSKGIRLELLNDHVLEQRKLQSGGDDA